MQFEDTIELYIKLYLKVKFLTSTTTANYHHRVRWGLSFSFYSQHFSFKVDFVVNFLREFHSSIPVLLFWPFTFVDNTSFFPLPYIIVIIEILIFFAGFFIILFLSLIEMFVLMTSA